MSYRADYVVPTPAPRLAPAEDLFDILRQLPTAAQFSASDSRRERLLRLLLRLRQAPLMRACVRLVPLSFQRKVKRSLSTRALHQIARDLL
jgi:hypothetical protein